MLPLWLLAQSPSFQVVVHPELLNSKGELDADVASQFPEMAAALKKQREQEQQNGKDQKDSDKQ